MKSHSWSLSDYWNHARWFATQFFFSWHIVVRFLFKNIVFPDYLSFLGDATTVFAVGLVWIQSSSLPGTILCFCRRQFLLKYILHLLQNCIISAWQKETLPAFLQLLSIFTFFVCFDKKIKVLTTGSSPATPIVLFYFRFVFCLQNHHSHCTMG